MTSTLGTTALIGAAVTTAMVAGLMFVYAHDVMPAISGLDDPAHLAAFRRLDAAIYNPWMMTTFVGSPVLTFAALLLHLSDRGSVLAWIAVALVFVVVTILITGAIHLPLNAEVQDAAPDFKDAAALRERFEGRWVLWNIARTITATGGLVALCVALFTAGRASG